MSAATATPTEYDKEQDEQIKAQGKAIDRLNEKVFPGEHQCPAGQHWDAAQGKCVPDTVDCGPDPDPNDEHIAHGGWGGDLGSPETWESVSMKDDPKLWKVVDKAGTNIAHKFESEAEADKYIKYHQCMKENGDTDPPPPSPPPGPPPAGGDYPYPAKGTAMQSTTRGPTTRHYASGKPDDFTIEKNVKSIKFKNYQCVCDIANDCQWAHDDTFSIKLGGTHMGTGWFDNSLSVYQGKTGLGTEPEHPSTNLYVIKGPAVGDTRGKRFKYACTYFTDANKVELWTNFGQGWIKQVEGTNIDGFNPKSSEDEFQLRIDGFKEKDKPPTIHSAVVTEI